MNDAPNSSLPFIILRHTFADEPGRDHFDFLFETEPGTDPDARTLIAFRVSKLGPDGFMAEAERLEPHRRRYLSFEGPVTGDRGRVERVRSGTVSVRECGEVIEIWSVFDDEPSCVRHHTGEHTGGGWWRFTAR